MRDDQMALYCCRTVAAAGYLAGAAEMLGKLEADGSLDDAMYFNDELQNMTQVIIVKRQKAEDCQYLRDSI